MKFILIAALSFFSVNSFANESGMDHKAMEKKMDKMSFADAKKWKLDMVEKKSSMVEKERQCLTAATDKSGLKDCMKQMHEEHKDMKEKMSE